MLIVEDLLVSDELLTEHFTCNLKACKGACCWEGDFGAPLEPEEKDVLDDLKDIVAPYLSDESNRAIEAHGTHTYFEGMEDYGTALLPDGACVFMTRDAFGIAGCAIEKAWRDGNTTFQKPISCHLYPVRVMKTQEGTEYALNYDRWDICCNGCTVPGGEQVKLYKFVKSALVRRYGQEFYDQLEYLDSMVSQPDLDDAGH